MAYKEFKHNYFSYNKGFLKHKSKVLIILLFLLPACFASNVKLIENNKIVPGMSKPEVAYVFAFQSILENPFLPLAYREYFPSERKEILSDDNDKNVYYVFKNVSNEVKCGWWICNYGDGILDKTFLNYSAAVNYVKKTEKKKYIQKKTVTIVDKGKKQTISAEKNVLDELSKVTKDYKDGKISESEFEKRKEEILR